MAEWNKIEEVKKDEKTDKVVKLRGWVYRERSTNKVAFITLRDSSGTIQCVFKKGTPGFEEAKNTHIESSVMITGEIKKDDRAPGGYELKGKKMKHYQKAKKFPITEDPSTSFLMDVRHLWLRSSKINKMLKAREKTLKYFREFFEEKGFYEVQPPLLTQAGVEGGSTLFGLDYFNETAYLTQSSQLYLEAFMTSLEKVYCIAPSFRAEKSRTSKHLTEYWHLEAEMAWYENKDNMKFQEEMLSYIVNKLAEEDKEILKYFGREPKTLKEIKPPFKRLSYTEAIEELQSQGTKIEWGEDFGTGHEKALTEEIKEPLVIYNFPKKIKPFYMPESDEVEKKTVRCNDVLAPEGYGEIIGGSERIWKLEELLKRLEKTGTDKDAYEWYIDLRKYGSVPHSGFGLGIERLLSWILKRNHIRETIGFPRTINRVYP
ncbi:MAG: asparagine--tRNA ligase [archaeon]